jgi:hypothetical protein
MAQRTREHGGKNIEGRMTSVEQILPTLATKADLEAAREDLRADIQAGVAPLASKAELQAAVALLATKAELEAAVARLATKAELEAAVALLATKAELQAAIAPLATRDEVKAEIREEGVRTRRHFDVVAESMRADIRITLEGLVAMQARCDTRHQETTGILTGHDRRLTRVEASPLKRR